MIKLSNGINGPISTWRDWLGIVASIGCAIHCAAMPFVIAYLPLLGLSFLADEAFHKWMAVICFLIAAAAFVPGIRKHGNWIPISVGLVGIVCITFAAFGLAGECCPSCEPTADVGPDVAIVESGCDQCDECDHCHTQVADDPNEETANSEVSQAKSEEGVLSAFAPWITPFGGLLLVAAHLLNRRFGCLCGCCDA